MLHHTHRHNQSFTLIELLIVIAIIAILAAVIVASTGNARKNARDVRRTQDLDALKTALEFYYDDHKQYPQGNIGPGGTSSDTGFCIEKATDANQFQNLLVSGNYVSTIPKDPLYQDVPDPDYCYWYQTKDNGQKFKLFARVENQDFDPAIKDGGLYASHYEAYSINTGSNQIVFGGSTGGGGGSFFTCGYFTVQDSDGNIYNTVKIGDQCWLKQNLNVGTMIQGTVNPTNNSTIEKYCYNNDLNNCTTYGGLYQWNEAMQYTTVEGAQGICPTGWHIPTDAEWHTLENGLKDEGAICNPNRDGVWDCATAGTKLKVGGSSGFEGKLGGYRGTDSSFYRLSSAGYFWSSSQSSASNAWVRRLDSGSPAVHRYYGGNKADGFSVRCLKD